MPGTAQTQTGIPSRSGMPDDRSTMLYILEEPQMRGEGERLRTFQTWPTDAPVTSGDLAKAGFFFLGQGDKVQCFCCGGVLRCWVHGDSPTAEHKRHFPTCSFIRGRAVGNIPLQGGFSDSVDGQLLSQLQRMTMDDQGTAGQAVYPEMEAEDSRLTTFHNWPTEASVQPDVLARAGFFYTGHGDNVKCFYCDGGLRNWEPGDDPWQEHAKWFPRCEFLIQSRGQEYISNIQDAHFHLGDTLPAGGSQTSTGREVGSRNDLVGSLATSSAMLSPVVQTVLQMGFEASLVESLVQTKYLLTGQHYFHVSDLVSDVLQAEEEDRQSRVPSGREPSPEELLRQLQEERTCKVCMDKLVSIVFIPCGHLVVCGDCAASLRHCPICRAIIRGSVRAFMS
uniref:baculoviral IAP repeat-containing protein 7 isoform X2 n=1 Tax=Doryrhamphus excisus TaxID=161450 RepID=UPI0025AE8343|nr:baculoviral IAP repeat-containing protein 7 isoform X2 [Doryrhamphus excisus]